jgi:hypothetical protein
MAQNVYSLNVVGYVNVTLPPQQFTCLANPLDASLGGTVANGNDITNLFQGANGGDSVSIWIPSAIDYSTTIPSYSTRTKTWSANHALPPGQALLYFNKGAAAEVITFTGQVPQGTYNVGTLPGSAFSMLGSPVPIGGDPTNSTTVLGLAPSGSDTIAEFNGAAVDWTSTIIWSSRTKSWGGTAVTNIRPGQGFLYFNHGSANTWVSNFTVQ